MRLQMLLLGQVEPHDSIHNDRYQSDRRYITQNTSYFPSRLCFIFVVCDYCTQPQHCIRWRSNVFVLFTDTLTYLLMTHIELILVDVSNDVLADIANGSSIRFNELVDKCLTHCSSAESFPVCASIVKRTSWFGGKTMERKETIQECQAKLAARLKHSLSSYVRIQDKYLHLTSLLLKSQAFHLAMATKNDRPIIDLPKSRKGKPYIPGNDSFQFSVSHQYPFAGIAQCRTNNKTRVGFDIVVFEKLNTILYKSPEEFVEVFQSNFAASEWNAIQAATHVIQEFYLRWAIKEAYTKAVGDGMSFEFSSFETKLNHVETSLWDYVSTRPNGCFISGTVCLLTTNQIEPWSFYFHELRSGTELTGYLCTCSESPEMSDEKTIYHEMSWWLIRDVADWHSSISD